MKLRKLTEEERVLSEQARKEANRRISQKREEFRQPTMFRARKRSRAEAAAAFPLIDGLPTKFVSNRSDVEFLGDYLRVQKFLSTFDKSYIVTLDQSLRFAVPSLHIAFTRTKGDALGYIYYYGYHRNPCLDALTGLPLPVINIDDDIIS